MEKNQLADMTGWSEERKKTFQCMSVEKKETFEEVLANVFPVSVRENIRKNTMKRMRILIRQAQRLNENNI